MLIICQIDWREVGVTFKMQCVRNCTLSSLVSFIPDLRSAKRCSGRPSNVYQRFGHMHHYSKVPMSYELSNEPKRNIVRCPEAPQRGPQRRQFCRYRIKKSTLLEESCAA